jgi:putative nucleotidyltransferase with HDIG domain
LALGGEPARQTRHGHGQPAQQGDFTVNAVAARLPFLEIVDPFGGIRDLKARVLRTPGPPEDSFSDDALRMLRAARFAAQLGFTVVPEVQAAMTAMAGRLSAVSAERIGAELTKLICSPGPDGPVRGISVLVGTGVAEQILLEVPRLRLETDEHFRHKDVYQHTLTVLARAATLEAAYGLENDLVVRLAALLHDIGKPETRRVLPDGRVTFHHHDLGTEIMEVLGIPPGPLVGQAHRFLLELRMEHGPLGRDRAGQELLRWAQAKGLDVPAPPDTPLAEG